MSCCLTVIERDGHVLLLGCYCGKKIKILFSFCVQSNSHPLPIVFLSGIVIVLQDFLSIFNRLHRHNHVSQNESQIFTTYTRHGSIIRSSCMFQIKPRIPGSMSGDTCRKLFFVFFLRIIFGECRYLKYPPTVLP